MKKGFTVVEVMVVVIILMALSYLIGSSCTRGKWFAREKPLAENIERIEEKKPQPISALEQNEINKKLCSVKYLFEVKGVYFYTAVVDGEKIYFTISQIQNGYGNIANITK